MHQSTQPALVGLPGLTVRPYQVRVVLIQNGQSGRGISQIVVTFHACGYCQAPRYHDGLRLARSPCQLECHVVQLWSNVMTSSVNHDPKQTLWNVKWRTFLRRQLIEKVWVSNPSNPNQNACGNITRKTMKCQCAISCSKLRG